MWHRLSLNPNAISLLEKYPDKIDWGCLSSNPNAIHLLEKNIDKIAWTALVINPNAIHLLEQHKDKVNWYWLSMNPAIFEYDYNSIVTYFKPILQGVIQNRFHPKNICKFYSWGFEEFEEFQDL